MAGSSQPHGVLVSSASGFSFVVRDDMALLGKVERLGRKTFKRSETMDLVYTLALPHKRLYCAVSPADHEALLGYFVLSKLKRQASIDKLCVVQEQRRRGIGIALVLHAIQLCKQSACRLVFLWVDEANELARRLYVAVEFEQVQRVEDTYGPGRHGLKMCLDLVPSSSSPELCTI